MPITKNKKSLSVNLLVILIIFTFIPRIFSITFKINKVEEEIPSKASEVVSETVNQYTNYTQEVNDFFNLFDIDNQNVDDNNSTNPRVKSVNSDSIENIAESYYSSTNAYTTYLGDQLTNEMQINVYKLLGDAVKTYLNTGVMNRISITNIYDDKYSRGYISQNCIRAAVAYYYDNPEIWFIEKVTLEYFYDMGTDYPSGADVNISLLPGYTYSQITSKHTKVMNSAKSLAANAVAKASTDYDKIKYVHDYFVGKLSYDYNNQKDSDNVVGAYINNKVDCLGYTMAFALMTQLLNIPSIIIFGKIADEGHAWNYVKLNNAWYAIDVTFDDSYSDNTYFLVGTNTYIKYAGDTFGNSRTIDPTYDRTSLATYNHFTFPTLSKTSYSSLPTAKSGGACGAGIAMCPGVECCSKYGYCGVSTTHCGSGCQAGYGLCNGTTTTTKKTTTTKTSTATGSTDRCGAGYGSCAAGLCCSQYGYCGSTTEHCALSDGCQSAYGLCKSTTVSTVTDRCGSAYGSCAGANECCSKYNYCGTTADHCGTGCQIAYGICS